MWKVLVVSTGFAVLAGMIGWSPMVDENVALGAQVVFTASMLAVMGCGAQAISKNRKR